MGIWLKNYEIINLDNGLTYTGGPGKFVWHTMQGSIESCINTFKSDPGKSSHFAISWRKKRKVQFISLDHSAKSLRNLAGGVETNRDQAYQTEVEGFADESQDWPDEAWDFLGQHMAEVWIASGRSFKLESVNKRWVDARDGTIATSNAPQRLTIVEYDNFNGICGHQHVPENDHYDPGRFQIDKIIAAAKKYAGIDSPAPEQRRGDKLITGSINHDGRGMEWKIQKATNRVWHRWQDKANSWYGPWVPFYGNKDRMTGPTNDPGTFTSVTSYTNADGRVSVSAYNYDFDAVFETWQYKEDDRIVWADWAQVGR